MKASLTISKYRPPNYFIIRLDRNLHRYPSVAASTITSATRQIICDVAYAMLMLGTVLMGWRLNGQTNHAPAPTVMALELAEGTVRVLDRVDRVLLERVDGVFVFGIVWRFS